MIQPPVVATQIVPSHLPIPNIRSPKPKSPAIKVADIEPVHLPPADPAPCLPSPDYFYVRGHADPFNRRPTINPANDSFPSRSVLGGHQREPTPQLYDADLRSLKLKPFLAAYEAETDWRKQSAIFKALFHPSSIDLGISALLEKINHEIAGSTRPLPDLVTPEQEDKDKQGKLRRELWQECCRVSWQEDEHNNGLRLSFAASADAVGYKQKKKTLESFLADVRAKYRYLFKKVISDSAPIWSPRKQPKEKRVGRPRTLHLENGEWVPECTRGCNLAFREHVCIHGVQFTTRCTEACDKCRTPFKPKRGTLHDLST